MIKTPEEFLIQVILIFEICYLDLTMFHYSSSFIIGRANSAGGLTWPKKPGIQYWNKLIEYINLSSL
jgi:hypothetical protein